MQDLFHKPHQLLFVGCLSLSLVACGGSRVGDSNSAPVANVAHAPDDLSVDETLSF